MTNIKFEYPVLIFKNNDTQMFALQNNLGIASKGGESFYKGQLIVVDSDGKIFELKDAKVKGKADFVISLKYFQPMIELDLIFEKTGELSFLELKLRVIKHLNKHFKSWEALGPFELIKNDVEKKDSFSSLIKTFV